MRRGVLSQDLRQALDAERVTTGRRLNLFRFVGVGVFWALFCVLGELMHRPVWQSNFWLLSSYFILSTGLFVTGRRFAPVARVTGYALAFFDIPAICAVQASTFPSSTSPGAVAGFTIAVNVVLVALSALSLDGGQVVATAVMGTAAGIFLQHWAGISPGAMVSTVPVVGLAASAAYALIQRFITLTSELLAQADVRKALQSKLFLADRMAAVGTVAASVAHEVSNPMTYVLGNLELLQSRLGGPGGEPSEIRDWVNSAYAGAQHVVRVTRNLKGFARKDEESTARIEVRPVVETTLSVAQAEIKSRAQLRTDFRPVPSVIANEGRLTQVLLNLLINAAQAIPPGDPAHNTVGISLRESNGSVVVAISDTGSGISPENQAQLFQSFFTTKPQGEGTGLGLSISYEIVRNLGGTIQVQSQPGKGTTFEVILPGADMAGTPAARPQRVV